MSVAKVHGKEIGMNIGIIGAENSHTRHFCQVFNGEKRHEAYRVTHLYGQDAPETAAALAKEYGLVQAGSEEELIAAVDAVVVTYRKGSLHFAPVMKALRAGKPVFNDKPFSTDAAKAAEIAAYAQEQNLLLCGGSNLKSLPDIKRLKETIQPGSDITISFAADPGSPYDGYWFYGIHLAELCVELMGEGFTSVAATRNGSRVKAEVNYATGKAQLVTSPDKEELTITVCRDGIETRHDIRMQYESVGPDEFATMLASGKPPRAYSSYAAAVRLLADIIRAAGL